MGQPGAKAAADIKKLEAEGLRRQTKGPRDDAVEAQRLLKELTGADRVQIFDHWRSSPTVLPPDASQPRRNRKATLARGTETEGL